MFSISKDYAPPFSMIAPFFIIGTIFFFLGSVALLFLDPKMGHFDPNIAGWVHWYLLGFVMMIIFGAMAQLIPVVVEVGHHSVDLYYVIWPLLLIGTLLMVLGFWWASAVLPYGGLLVLTAMLIYLYDTLMTLKKVTNVTLTVKTAVAANLFLTTGIVVGFLMTLAIGAGVKIDVAWWLSTHAVLVLGGYVVLTIMGLSLILLPMFGLAHGFDETPINRAFNLMLAGVLLHLFSTLVGLSVGRVLAMALMLVAVGLYLYQVWLIYKLRARKENDIWARSMFFGYGALVVAAFLGFLTFFVDSERLVLSAAWFLIMGFVTFLITGHLYKIIPFLVWFERFSPLVGKERVPMLQEMYPKHMADWEFALTASGVVIAGLGILLGVNDLYRGGVALLIVGAGFMLASVKWMLSFGVKK
ncbi:hypothetical protein [Nitratifractor salsuginis]|uniref:Uncharacterized protein n=1 Tax=Nitratifractor salsuginis (strain DSM 16511 / JCM 12458 / E9I37-1) TaxID=749222 RepID=E6X0J6_NITSE|nr:hypothetical protein [Nitratifractor salsuginis]ADV46846.1 hypothetical protein Nitsa_1598 [Nitratifractor salsuginis DSM 16511]